MKGEELFKGEKEALDKFYGRDSTIEEEPIMPEEILTSMGMASYGYRRGYISREVFADLAWELAGKFFALPQVALPPQLTMLKDMRKEAVISEEAETVAYLDILIKDAKERRG